MKLRVNHRNGIYVEKTDSVLCEVFCTPEGESPKWLFEHGWLPTVRGEWYQAKSSRIVMYREHFTKPNLNGIRISTVGDWSKILHESIPHYSYLNLEHIEYMIESADTIVYFEDKAFACLNIYDKIPYVSTVIGTRHNKNLLEYVVPVMKDVCFKIEDETPYSLMSDIYIGEWYDKFAFKSTLMGFEWWDGEQWIHGSN